MSTIFSDLSSADLLLVLAALSATIYAVLWLPREASLQRAAAKIVPMVLLIAAALIGSLPILILAALGACAVGDWFLAFEDEKNFHTGLGAFLAGHLFFIAYFVTSDGFVFLPNSDTALLALILAALIIMVLMRLWPHLGPMKAPVIAYAVTIAVMAFTARLASPGTIILAGIALFMLSDILLAQDKFTPLANSLGRRITPWLVWIFYITGQTLIVLGFLQGN